MVLTSANILLVGSVLLFISIVAARAGYRFGVPVLLLFLVVGMLFGSDGYGIQFNNPGSAQFIGVIALSIILFSGGMDTKFTEVRPIIVPGVVLATAGVMITTLITALFIYWITSFMSGIPNLTLPESMLLAAVMSSTDSASVFSILRSRGLSLKQNLKPLLELESGSNDPMAYMLTVILIGFIQTGNMSVWDGIIQLVVQFSIGALFGYLMGRIAVKIINRLNIGSASLYPVLLLAFVFFIFSFTDMLQGNGYLAVYIAGLVVGNKKVQHSKIMSTFFDGFAWLCQLVMFLTLGLLVNPRELIPVIGVGLVIAVVMVLISRPATVFLCLWPFRKLTAKARSYVSWVGLRGAVPIIFATYPLIAGVKHAPMIFNVVFFLTIVSLLVQGTTVNTMARVLGLVNEDTRKNPTIGFELPEGAGSTMTEIEVTPQLLADGNMLLDLSLAEAAVVAMVKRKDQYFVPEENTRLEVGDKLLVIIDGKESITPGPTFVETDADIATDIDPGPDSPSAA